MMQMVLIKNLLQGFYKKKNNNNKPVTTLVVCKSEVPQAYKML